MFRSAITRQARLFSTQAPLRKSVLDTAKETLQSANKAVGETLAKGIDSAGKSSSIRAVQNASSSSATTHRPRLSRLAPHPRLTKEHSTDISQSPQQPPATRRRRRTSLQARLKVPPLRWAERLQVRHLSYRERPKEWPKNRSRRCP